MPERKHDAMIRLAAVALLVACTAQRSDMSRLAACEEQADAWCGDATDACRRVWVDQWCDPPHWTDPVSSVAQDACLDAIAARRPDATGVPAECWRTWVRQDGFSF